MSTKQESLPAQKLESLPAQKLESLPVQKLLSAKSALHTTIFGFETPTLQSGVFQMVLSSFPYELILVRGWGLKKNGIFG